MRKELKEVLLGVPELGLDLLKMIAGEERKGVEG